MPFAIKAEATTTALAAFVPAEAPTLIAAEANYIAIIQPLRTLVHAAQSKDQSSVAKQRNTASEGTHRDVSPEPPLTPPTIAPPLAPTPLVTTRSRWAASAWLIARGGRRGDLLGGQLGASQAGARLTYAILPERRVALAARVATPLNGRGREAAVGIDWQPLRLPFHLIAEQRIGLDGGKGGPTIEAVGGFGPIDVAHHISVEGYGQAGFIARDGGEAFADGAARAAYRVAGNGRRRLDLGVGVWGGAQRGAARLDVGPSLGIVTPVGDKAVRLTLDWRRRIAGDAAPGSGPALSIGSDF